jgi:positive regulator of sigma E activity
VFIKGINGEQGEVVSIHGNTATVKIKANESCGKCRLCKRISSTEMIVDALFTRPVHEGDKVVISIKPGTIVKSAVILYILPLIGLVIGYYFGKFISSTFRIMIKGELFPASMSLIFLFLTFIPIRLYDKKKQGDSRFRVHITDHISL